MGYYHDDDNDSGEGLAIIIAVTILLMPVIPIGDLAVYLVDAYTVESPNYIYILSWVTLAFSWSFLFFMLVSKYIESFAIMVTLFYLQGFVFAVILGTTKYAWWSNIIYGLAHSVFIGSTT